MLRRHALGAALIGSDPSAIDSERPGQVVLGTSQGATLPSDAPADMPIDRRHGEFSGILLILR
jgi:hypothetical protein